MTLWQAWQAVVDLAAEIYEPDDAIGLIGLLIVGLPSSIAAVFAGVALYRQRESSTKLDTVAEGVQETNRSVNCRSTPLRVDMDAMRSEMQRGFRDLTRDIGGLREELRTERIERIEGDRRRDE